MAYNTPGTPRAGRLRSGFGHTLSLVAVYFLVGIMVILAATYVTITKLYPDIPALESLENIYDEQSLSTEIYSADGEPLRAIANEKRFWVRYDEIPQCMIDAITSIEDRRFFQHWGFSSTDFLRAVIADIKSFSFSQGGSTLTQQLAKNLYFGTEKEIVRKIKEVLAAIQIERTYTKSEIIEMYLNKVELGNNTWGIQAGSQLYFNKDAIELTVPEAAMLAGIIQNTYRNNPLSSREDFRANALRRRNLTLDRMAADGKISHAAAFEEKAKEPRLQQASGGGYGKAPYFTEYVRRELVGRFGQETVMTGGLKVQTTLDYRLQRAAEDSLRAHLDYIQKNYADKQVRYHRPKGITEEEAVKDSLARTQVQGALVLIDVRTGAILAMVGGTGNYGENQFNRAIQAERQAGSVFKPFLYTAALDNGWRCSDTLLDSYVLYENVDGKGSSWEPQNFEKDFIGLMSLRDAMMHSRNVPAAKLMNDMDNRGIGPRNVVRYARKFGLTTVGDSNALPSLAVGTAPVKLIEITSAFTVFPNKGVLTTPFSIGRVRDKNDADLFVQTNGEGERSEVLDPAVAELMLSMLRSVATEGTAANTLRSKGMSDRPAAGKTGTGNEYKDAWFIGFTPYIACGVWVGFDSEETTLGSNAYGTGASAALPIWAGVVKEASNILALPKTDFTYNYITTQRICRDSHQKATPNCPESSIYTEYFIPGTEVTEECSIHGSHRGDIVNPAYPAPSNRRGY